MATIAIHKGQEAELIHGSINVPIHYSSTFKQRSPGELFSKFDYTRAGNPTVDALNQCYAGIEGGAFGLSFASGCAAATAVFLTLTAGDHILSIDDVYGGTNRMLNRIFKKFDLETTMIDLTLDNLEANVRPNTRILWIETPTNPTLKVTDIELVCGWARARGIVSVVDNTFASPFLQNPLRLGADVVLHSCTKYLGGHADIIAGMVVTNRKDLYDKIFFNLLSLGGCLSPMDAFLLLRSVKSLKARMLEHCKNGAAVVQYLSTHPKVTKIYYPGLESHLSYKIAQKQMRHPGAMLSFELRGDMDTARKFLKALKVFTLAESLGGVESLVESPALMTHMSVPAEQRALLGISDTLIRMSIGVEDVEDLLDDIEQALAVV
jgi:cystathionine beta-lyase/cystathionine gamma-synthase